MVIGNIAGANLGIIFIGYAMGNTAMKLTGDIIFSITFGFVSGWFLLTFVGLRVLIKCGDKKLLESWGIEVKNEH